MKKIAYYFCIGILTIAFAGLTGCQDLDTPYNNIPVVKTGEAMEISSNSAWLTYELEEGKAHCEISFEIGTQSDLSDAQNSSAFVGKLQPNTTYYYRAYAYYYMNEQMLCVYGDIKSFTTLDGFRIGKVTYTDWDGETIDMNEPPLGVTFVTQNWDTYHNEQLLWEDISWYFKNADIPWNELMIAYVYWPWTDTYQSIEQGYLPVQTYKYDGQHYLYAVHYIEEGASEVNINLTHTMSRVIFHFTIGGGNPSDYARVNHFEISNGDNKILPTIGNLYFNENSCIVPISDAYVLPLYYGYSFEISKGSMQDIILYSIPTTGSGTVELSLYLSDGSVLCTPLEISGWGRGETTEYTVTYSQSALYITDVTVEDWQEGEGGNITVND